MDEQRRSVILAALLSPCGPTIARADRLLGSTTQGRYAGSETVALFPNRASAIASKIPADVAVVHIEGWTEPGDGGLGDFVRMDGSTELLSAPAQAAVRPWHLRTADGSWWLRQTAGPVNFQMFGAIGLGSDDTDAIQASLDYHPAVFRDRPPVVIMIPGTHQVSKPIACMAHSASLTTAYGSDDLVTIIRAGRYDGHTFQFGNATTGCQRLVLEGLHLDVPTDGHWVSYAGEPQQHYTIGAVILSVTPDADGSTLWCRLHLDRPHELISGNRVYLSQVTTASGRASAYDRKTFLAMVVNQTDIRLADLDGSPARCYFRTSIAGDGASKLFSIAHRLGTLQLDSSILDSRGNVIDSPDVEIHAASPDVTRLAFSTAPERGQTYTVTVGLEAVLPGKARVQTGPLCSKVFVTGGEKAQVTAISQDKRCAVTFVSHRFVPGDLIIGESIGGMKQLGGRLYSVGSVLGKSITLNEPDGGPVDSSGYRSFSGSGSFSCIPQGFPSYVTATLDNLITGDYYHVMAYSPVRGRFARLQGFRTRAPLCVVGDAYCEYNEVVFGGIWDEDRPGLQESVAGIYLPAFSPNLRTLPTIRSPGLISSNTASAPRLVRRGNAAQVQKIDTGCRDGIYCEEAEGFELTGGYLGGHNRSMVRFKAMGTLVHLDIHDMFMDGSGGYGIHFEVGTSTVWNVNVHDLHSNGGDVSDGLIKVDDGTGVLPIPHLGSLTVHHCIGQGYRSAPVSLLGVVGAEIDANELNGYNQLDDTTGDPTLSAGVYVGPHSSKVFLRGGIYGGGINTTIGANHCRWGVYAALQGAAYAIGVASGLLGQSGGTVINANVAQD